MVAMDGAKSATAAFTAATVSTFAGDGTAGFNDGATSSAQFNNPYGVAVDSSGNVYVADYFNNRIRKISGGVVSTLAGDGTQSYLDGTGTAARFNFPSGVAVDSSGNVYVADVGNHRIRKITP
jgi:sugar lactone lactonase YvrE